MAGSMSRADLIADLKSSLHDAAVIFDADGDGDFTRMLDMAALDCGRVRRRTLLGEISIIPGQAEYPAPAGMLEYKSAIWGSHRCAKPWEPSWTGRLPDVTLVESTGEQILLFSPAPTAQQTEVLGTNFKFYYWAGHVIDEDAAGTSVKPADRGLLLQRAQAEAMKELAVRNSGKPVQLRDGVSGAPRNGTPSAIYQLLMNEFERMAA